MSDNPHPNTLETLLQFTPADLEANRARRLTPAQQHRLDGPRRFTWMIFVAAGVLFLVVAVIAYLADIPTAALLFGTLGLLLLIGFVWSLNRATRRDEARSVGILQGKLSLRRSRRRRTGAMGSTTVYHLSILGREIPIRRALYEALSAELSSGDGLYTAYYLEEDRTLLALERGAVALAAPADTPPAAPGLAPDGTPNDGELPPIMGGQQQAIRHAIDILDGRTAPPVSTTANHNSAAAGVNPLQLARAAARATIIDAGPAVLPLIATRLHRTEYQEIAGAMGESAIAPLMRLVARERGLVESALIDGVVGALTIMPWEILEKPLPPYIQPHHSPAVRMTALRVLSQRRNPQRFAILRVAARDPEPTIAARAQHTLARLDNFYSNM